MKKLGFFLLLLILIIPSSVFAAWNSDSMLGYWKLDETAQGGTATDSSGDSHTASPAGNGGGPAPTTDVPTTAYPNSRAADFNGTNQYLFASDHADFDTSTFTVSFWAKFDAVNSTHQTLIGRWQVGVKQQFVVQLTSNNKIGFWTGDGSTGTSGALESTLTPSQDTWYHITAVAAGTNRTLYINGTANKYTGTGTSPGATDIELTIGSKKNLGGTYFEFLDGKMDDIRYYNRALSDSEVNELASGNHTTATWDGSVSSNPEVSGNWDINAVPDPYTKWVIANTTLQPEGFIQFSMAGLTINQNAWFDLGTLNLTMNDSGTFSNQGTLLLKNSQALINFSNDTDSGNIMMTNTGATAGLVTGNTYHNLIINDSLRGYWKFDEGSGTTVNDASGYLNQGTSNGSTISSDIPTVSFINSNTLEFDGLDDYVSIQDDNSLNLATTFTVSAWVNLNSAKWQTIYSSGTQSGRWDIKIDDANRLLFTETAIQDYNSSGTIGSGWHHVAVVKNDDGADNVTFYIDGVSSGTASVGSVTSPSGEKRIGMLTQTNSEVLDGKLDDLRIYDRALSSGEIAAMAAGNQPDGGVGNVRLEQNLTVNNDLVINSGTLDTDSIMNNTINVAGNLDVNGGVLDMNSGDFNLTGTNQSITSSNTFYNLTKNVTGSATLTFPARGTTTITNTLTLSGAASNLLSLRSSISETQFRIDPQGTRNITYVNVEDSNNINATAIAYSSTNTYGDNLTNWTTSGPSPTPTPTPEPNIIQTTQSVYQHPSTTEAPTCNDQKPTGIPNLFQIDSAGTYVNIYFTKVEGATGYAISYGLDQNANQYGDRFDYHAQDWIIGHTIHNLSTNTDYYFKVQPVSGCMAGEWSNVKQTKTKGILSNVTRFFSNLNPFTKTPVPPVMKNQNVQGMSTENNCNYTVKEGDSLWTISLNKWGSGAKYSEIIALNAGLNESTILQVGSSLHLCK